MIAARCRSHTYNRRLEDLPFYNGFDLDQGITKNRRLKSGIESLKIINGFIPFPQSEIQNYEIPWEGPNEIINIGNILNLLRKEMGPCARAIKYPAPVIKIPPKHFLENVC